MSDTRPSGFPLIPGNPKVTQEVATIDQRGRLRLLPRWLDRLSWAHEKNEVPALLTLLVPGRISLRSWIKYSPTVLEAYERLSLSSDTADLERLRLIQDRYARAAIPIDRRVHLGDAALLHLGLSLGSTENSPVYVSAMPEEIHILSPNLRDELLVRFSGDLEDLP